MAKKNKQHPPSSPAALVSNKRRRLAHVDGTSSSVPAVPSASTASLNSTSSCVTALAAPTVHIVAGSKIQAKVRAAMSALDGKSTTEPGSRSAANTDDARTAVPPADTSKESNGIVLVEARSIGTNKLITVIEIVKRTLESEGRRWWAYTGVKGTLEDIESLEDARWGDAHARGSLGDTPGESDEEEAFEPEGRGRVMADKVRSVPSLFVYLAVRSLPSLKAIYGEQCSQA